MEKTAAALSASNLFKVTPVGFKQPADVSRGLCVFSLCVTGAFFPSWPSLRTSPQTRTEPESRHFNLSASETRCVGGDRGFGHVLTRFAAILSSCLV